MRRGEQPGVLLDHALEQPHTGGAMRGHGGLLVVPKKLHPGALQAIALDASLEAKIGARAWDRGDEGEVELT